MATSEHENIVSTFTVALARMNRVVDYLREHGETENANIIAKNVNEMVVHFTNSAIKLGTDTQDPREYFDGRDPYPKEADLNKENEPFSNGVSDEVDRKGQKGKVPSYESEPTSATSQAPPSPAVIRKPNQQSLLNSWARIAATPPMSNNSVVVKPKPVVLKTHRSQSSVSTPKPVAYLPETLSEQLRVIWVVGCTSRTSLTFITDQIHEGPLLSVAFSEPDNAICIVFQYGSCAASFLETNALILNQTGACCYGSGYELMVGSALPMDSDLKVMEPPIRERRRLTFVKAGLFHDVTKAQFEKDLVNLVGLINIERVWVFNSGNATGVFSSTSVARMVRDHFENLSKNPGRYQGLICTYSSDPTEKPVKWVSQHQHNGNGAANYCYTTPRPAGNISNGAANYGYAAQRSTSNNFGHDGTDSSPGWEKVKKNRRR